MSGFEAFFDDAALFPPGSASMPDAVAAHVGYRGEPEARYVGPFVCAVDRLGELSAAVDAFDVEVRLDVSVVGAADRVAAAMNQLPPHVRVASAEVRVNGSLEGLPAGVTCFVELPVDADYRRWLPMLVERGLRGKLRMGGTTEDAFPSIPRVAEYVYAAVAAGCSFKCTAGLHHLVGYRDPATGFEHCGFGNVLLAVDAAMGGASAEHVSVVLDDRDGALDALRALPVGRLDAVRRLFVSIGTCSITEPVDDLLAAGLVRA